MNKQDSYSNLQRFKRLLFYTAGIEKSSGGQMVRL